MSTPALKHTEGPWTYGVRRDGSIWLALGDPKRPFAARYQTDFCGTEADARLICAAPDLLRHLEFAVSVLERIPTLAGTAQVTAMRTAIAAAGQQPKEPHDGCFIDW